MKIAVIGLTGRMSGAVIEEITKHSDCQLSGIFPEEKILHDTYNIFNSIEDLANNSQAVIDFTKPAVSLEFLSKLANKNIVYVCGTTGFSEKEFQEFQEAAKYVTTIWSPNMSIGINLMQKLLKNVTKTLGSKFDSAIIDIHHKHKKDAPSGTALMFAKTIKELTHQDPQISSLRIGEVPGEHQIIFSSADESFTLTHNAFNRKIFANGAIKACFWGKDKPKGLYSMQDVIDFND